MRPLSLLLMLAWLTACSPGEQHFADLAMLERPTTPNTYLVCPAHLTTATVDREPPVYPVSLAELEALWVDALREEPRTSLIAADAQGHRYLYVQRTAVLRFPDVIQIAFVEVPPDGATLCIYSRSIYGRSDFGQNERRVEDWLGRFTPAAAPIAGDAATR